MRRFVVFLAISALTLILLSALPQHAQNTPEQSNQDEHTGRSMAVNLLRAINTAEYDYKFKHGNGSFADWGTLASEEFKGRGMEFASRNEPQFANKPQFLLQGEVPRAFEVLPGWMLRFNVHADGNGYDVMLEDTTDKTSGCAFITDERAVIREAKSI